MTYQPNLLIGWVTGSDTSFETMPEDELLSICWKMLKGAIGQEFNNYTEPIRVIRSTCLELTSTFQRVKQLPLNGE